MIFKISNLPSISAINDISGGSRSGDSITPSLSGEPSILITTDDLIEISVKGTPGAIYSPNTPNSGYYSGTGWASAKINLKTLFRHIVQKIINIIYNKTFYQETEGVNSVFTNKGYVKIIIKDANGNYKYRYIRTYLKVGESDVVPADELPNNYE